MPASTLPDVAALYVAERRWADHVAAARADFDEDRPAEDRWLSWQRVVRARVDMNDTGRLVEPLPAATVATLAAAHDALEEVVRSAARHAPTARTLMAMGNLPGRLHRTLLGLAGGARARPLADLRPDQRRDRWLVVDVQNLVGVHTPGIGYWLVAAASPAAALPHRWGPRLAYRVPALVADAVLGHHPSSQVEAAPAQSRDCAEVAATALRLWTENRHRQVPLAHWRHAVTAARRITS